MRHTIILGILLIIGIKSYAHKDRYFNYKFDNVSVRFKTGYRFEEIKNAQIIGQYAAILCKELRYKQTVLLDFIHDYGQSYKGKNFRFVNIGSDVYNTVSFYGLAHDNSNEEPVYQMIPFSKIEEQDSGKLEKLVHSSEPVDNLQKVVIRQFGFHFDVNITLKLLHHAIMKPKDVINSTQKDSLHSYLPNMYYELNTIPKTKIDSICTLKIQSVDEVIGQKIYAKQDTSVHSRLTYSYYAQNNNYYFYVRQNNYETVLDTLKQIYSFELNNDNWESLFVFETPNSFKYYEYDRFNKEFTKSKRHEIQKDEHESIVFYNVNWISDDLFFINRSNCFDMSAIKIFPYLSRDDVLIHDFDSYLELKRQDK
jgi:plasmid maintenance system killer protein